MRKILIVAVIIFSIYSINLQNNETNNIKISEKISTKGLINENKLVYNYNNKIIKYRNENDIEEVHPPTYDIPLSEDLQLYIWELCEEYGINYELVLSLIKVESNFNSNVISYNGSSVGLMQINQYDTLYWLSRQVGLKNPDPYNPYHSVKMGIWYLNYLKQYWLDKGLNEEEARKAMLISYNRGIYNANIYIKKNGFNSDYISKINEYKKELREVGKDA